MRIQGQADNFEEAANWLVEHIEGRIGHVAVIAAQKGHIRGCIDVFKCAFDHNDRYDEVPRSSIYQREIICGNTHVRFFAAGDIEETMRGRWFDWIVFFGSVPDEIQSRILVHMKPFYQVIYVDA